MSLIGALDGGVKADIAAVGDHIGVAGQNIGTDVDSASCGGQVGIAGVDSGIDAEQVLAGEIDVDAVEKSCTVGEAIRLAVAGSHIRLPVFDGRIDRVIGVLNTMDLLGVDESASIESYISPTHYVPGSKSAESMLVELRKDGDAMAVVMDEFGGAEGIITIEDIIEEVMEDMQDEYDRQEKPAEWLKKLGHHDYLVSARADPSMLNEKLGLKLPEGDYDTLSGFLLENAREIPKVGTVIEVAGIKFTIQRATPQVIQEVQIVW